MYSASFKDFWMANNFLWLYCMLFANLKVKPSKVLLEFLPLKSEGTSSFCVTVPGRGDEFKSLITSGLFKFYGKGQMSYTSLTSDDTH